MPFTRDTLQTIIDRIERGIEARLFGKLAMLRTAVLRVLARVFAAAIYGNYGYLEWLAKQIFVTSCDEWFLENVHGVMWNVKRNPGTFAVGTIRINGSKEVTIPAGQRLVYTNGVEYGTVSALVLTAGGGYTGTVNIQAVEVGEIGNVTREEISSPPITLTFVTPIDGVEDTANVISGGSWGNIAGGEDKEGVEPYRARILQRIQNTPAGGNMADYDRWALSFSGVSRAWCYPRANGPGTVVEVVTVTGDDPVPSPAFLSNLLTYMSTLKPATADLTIESITDSTGAAGKAIVNMSINLYSSTAGADYQAAILDNIRTLFAPHKPGTSVPISQVRAAISNTGVVDYTITAMTLDGSSISVNADIPLTGYAYPWLGSISFGVM